MTENINPIADAAQQFFSETLSSQDGQNYTMAHFINNVAGFLEKYAPLDSEPGSKEHWDEAHCSALDLTLLAVTGDDLKEGKWSNNSQSNIVAAHEMLQTAFNTLEKISTIKSNDSDSYEIKCQAELLLEYKDSVELLAEQLSTKLNGHEELVTLKDFLDRRVGIYIKPGEKPIQTLSQNGKPPRGIFPSQFAGDKETGSDGFISIASVLEKMENLFSALESIDDPKDRFILNNIKDIREKNWQLIAFHDKPEETDKLNSETISDVPRQIDELLETVQLIRNEQTNLKGRDSILKQADDILSVRRQMRIMNERLKEALSQTQGQSPDLH